MSKARLCCFQLGDFKKATEYLAEWLLAKIDSFKIDKRDFSEDKLQSDIERLRNLDDPKAIQKALPEIARLTEIVRNRSIDLWLEEDATKKLVSTFRSKQNQDSKWINNETLGIDSLELECHILSKNLFSANNWFVFMLHIELPELNNDYNLAEWVMQFNPNGLDLDTWKFGYHEDDFLYSLLHSHMWYRGGTTLGLNGLDAMARLIDTFLRSGGKEITDGSMRRIVCENTGIQIMVASVEFMCKCIIEAFVGILQESRYGDLPDLPDSVVELNSTLLRHEDLQEYQKFFGTSIEVYLTNQKLRKAVTETDRIAIRWSLKHEILDAPPTDRDALKFYNSIYSDPMEWEFCEKSVLGLLLDRVSSYVEDHSPRQLWSYCPEVREIGRSVVRDVLPQIDDKELVASTYRSWPEIVVPHLTSQLHSLRGFGHDHTIELATRLVSEVRPKYSIQMLDVGDKVATLEREMRDKLKALYGVSRLKVLDQFIQDSTRSNRESPRERMQEFQVGMSARKIRHNEVSIFDFITFGALKEHLWSHVKKDDKPTDKPQFEPSPIPKPEFSYHAIIVSAFRNAWAHHQPVLSGFDKFDDSHHFVREWVKCLEKSDQ